MQTILMTATLIAISAGPVPPPPEDRDPVKEESRRFARSLFLLTDQIVRNYVKPLSLEDVHVAALNSLYQSARTQPPRNLRTQIRQASNLASALYEGKADVLMPDIDPREQLLAKLYDSLGKSVSHDKAMRACAKGILTLLDEHSGLVTLEEQRLGSGLDRIRTGVGLEVEEAIAKGPLVVRAVHLGGPAQRLGIRPGDLITQIDGKSIIDTPREKFALFRTARLNDYPNFPPLPRDDKAPPPSEVHVEFRRPNESTSKTIRLPSERFSAETVLGVRRRDDNSHDHWLDEKRKLAYVRISALGPGTATDLRATLEYLRDLRMRGMVLDLRWCPGGYLLEATGSAELFLGNAVIATEKSRHEKDVYYRSSKVGDKFLDFPLVVLVNRETIGGAELIAAALQDNERAKVVGQRTHGKGSVQMMLRVSSELTMKLTKGTFARPSGKNLHRFTEYGPADEWGVLPDEDFRLSPQLSARLKEWYQLHALRNGISDERLPLDDPEADSQRVAALEELKKLVKQ